MADLTEEDVFNNDVDPEEGIREARKAMAEEEPEEVGAVETEELEDESADDTPADASEEEPELETGSEEEDETSESTDEPSEEEPSTETETTPSLDLSEVRKFNANGEEYEFTVQEMLDQFASVFGKSVDYTRKTQQIAPYRKMISALEDESITHDQLNLAIDALKGDKGAIRKLIDNHGIDTYDLSEEESTAYTPKEYGKDETVLNLQETVSRLERDPEYSTTVQTANSWDQASQKEILNNPQYLEGLHNDVKSGMYDKVRPLAVKMKALDGNTKSDIEYYMLAGQQLSAQQQKASTAQSEADRLNAESQAAVESAEKASSEASRKRSASSTSARADKSVIDYLDDDDEKFDAWLAKVKASQ